MMCKIEFVFFCITMNFPIITYKGMWELIEVSTQWPIIKKVYIATGEALPIHFGELNYFVKKLSDEWERSREQFTNFAEVTEDGIVVFANRETYESILEELRNIATRRFDRTDNDQMLHREFIDVIIRIDNYLRCQRLLVKCNELRGYINEVFAKSKELKVTNDKLMERIHEYERARHDDTTNSSV